LLRPCTPIETLYLGDPNSSLSFSQLVNETSLLKNKKDSFYLMSNVKKLSNEYPNFQFLNSLNIDINEEASLLFYDLKKLTSLIYSILKDFHRLSDPFETIKILTDFFQDPTLFSGFQFENGSKISNGNLVHNITRQIIQTNNLAARDLFLFIFILENFKTQVCDSFV
jgi:hypothetical protein